MFQVKQTLIDKALTEIETEKRNVTLAGQEQNEALMTRGDLRFANILLNL